MCFLSDSHSSALGPLFKDVAILEYLSITKHLTTCVIPYFYPFYYDGVGRCLLVHVSSMFIRS